jgi:hypothetical protein
VVRGLPTWFLICKLAFNLILKKTQLT